jgi:threonylcarbamoyladenosine tRNA methylthiotransferase MtaB
MSRWVEGPVDFAGLVAAVLDLEGDFRLRLGSVEPDRLDNRLIDLFSHPKMTPHIHLCLQSGSERILRAMRRQYTAAGFEELSGEFRRRVPDFNITTDVIVGFPGESESDFQDTLDLCRRVGFGHIHTFPYSRRYGTGADRMDNHLDEAEKKKRSDLVRRLGTQSKKKYRLSLTGTEQDVLAETAFGEDRHLVVRGLSAPYVPVSFSIPAGRSIGEIRNRIWKVRIDKLGTGDDPDLEGTLLQAP